MPTQPFGHHKPFTRHVKLNCRSVLLHISGSLEVRGRPPLPRFSRSVQGVEEPVADAPDSSGGPRMGVRLELRMPVFVCRLTAEYHPGKESGRCRVIAQQRCILFIVHVWFRGWIPTQRVKFHPFFATQTFDECANVAKWDASAVPRAKREKARFS